VGRVSDLLLEPGDVGISASNRNYQGRMGSTEAKAYLASPEVVAASALAGKISGPGWYEAPADYAGVSLGEGDGIREEDRMATIEDMLEKVIKQADEMIESEERNLNGLANSSKDNSTTQPSASAPETLTDILPGFPEKVTGEIVFCDADNINTDAIYPGKYTYQDDVPREKMAEVCMENYDPSFRTVAKSGDILVSGFQLRLWQLKRTGRDSDIGQGHPARDCRQFRKHLQQEQHQQCLDGRGSPQTRS